jgi:predicted ATPase
LAKASEGQAVLISGEAGIGKSRLAHELTESLSGEPHGRWRLQCSPYHQSSALFPVIESFRHAVGPDVDVTPAERLGRLGQIVRDTGADLATTVPVLAELLSIDLADRYPKLRWSPERLKAETLDALVEHCVLTAKRAPLLLLIEMPIGSTPRRRSWPSGRSRGSPRRRC